FTVGDRRMILVRQPETFDLLELGSDGRVGKGIVRGLMRNGATWLAAAGGRIALTAILPDSGRATSMYELLADGRLAKLADGPVTQPFATTRGVYCLRVAGMAPGELLFVPWLDDQGRIAISVSPNV
ncbi:MAG TPA: hypothetical protein PKM88_14575, partial [bacterium]|nr:hypothetical protein [bacterium]